MPVVLGIDLGTTTIASIAVDTATNTLLARSTHPNDADTTEAAERARGCSEWSAPRMVRAAFACLRDISGRLGDRVHDVVGIGITAQQHGIVLVDASQQPLTPFIGWQDRRADQNVPGGNQTFTSKAVALAGLQAPYRTGCRLAAGYAAVTVYRLRELGELPGGARACFLSDYFGAAATGTRPITDPTTAASSGVLNLLTGDWDSDLLAALGLSPRLFPEVRPSGTRLGGLTAEAATETRLPEGLPVFSGMGDNQASFVGSVAERAGSLFVNIGTGGQVSAATERFLYDPRLETRPLPGGGFLLVCAGLSGGRAYAALESFFREVGREFFGLHAESLFAVMNRLAESIPGGSGGLRCEPYFSGTRQRPDLRASFSGISADTFTPAHLTRALLEGMARTFHEGYDSIRQHLPASVQRLVGAGNGLRENSLLARLVAARFGLPMTLPAHREEAAFGAALLAGVSAGVFPDWTAAGRLIRYE